MLVDILVFILVLGIMIVFHELGHFLAAKACGIYVERFMVGMPPRIFGIRIGETDYALGAMPFGGYVKMAGQEDTPLSDEERESTYGHVPPDRWFNNKRAWQRFIVIVAGPFMNLVLAVLLYALLAAVGAKVPETEIDSRIGQVLDNGPAFTAPLYRMADNGARPDTSREPDAKGWQTGDRILFINDNAIRNISDVGIDALLGQGKVQNVVIERPGPDGKPVRYLSPLEPKPLGDDKHSRFGVGPYYTALVAETQEGFPARAAGLQKGDVIIRANGKPIETTTLVQLVEDTPEGQTITLDVERNGQIVPLSLQPKTVGRLKDLSFAAPGGREKSETEKPVVLAVTDEFAKKTSIRVNDVIEQVDGQPATDARLREIERAKPGQSIKIEVSRPAILFGLLRKQSRETLELPVDTVRAIGAGFDSKMVFYRVPPSQIVPEAFAMTNQAVMRTLRTFEMLLTGKLSTKELGGPMMIYQVTTQAAREGHLWLLKITAFISVNLCIFNLLPLPVLDGSLLVYIVLEAIRRKPLNVRVLERIQQVGVFLLIGLMVFVTFNDVKRWLDRLMP